MKQIQNGIHTDWNCLKMCLCELAGERALLCSSAFSWHQPLGKDFIRKVSGQNSYETILEGHHLYFLEVLSVSPPLQRMRLEADTTALTSSLLPSLSERRSGNLNKSLGPFLSLFRLYENVTCKVREGLILLSHCCILNTTPLSWYTWEWGPRERGTLEGLSQSQKIILSPFQSPTP